MWAQWDWGQGPTIDGRATNLFCGWLGWSRFRVVMPTWDRTLATVVACRSHWPCPKRYNSSGASY